MRGEIDDPPMLHPSLSRPTIPIPIPLHPKSNQVPLSIHSKSITAAGTRSPVAPPPGAAARRQCACTPRGPPRAAQDPVVHHVHADVLPSPSIAVADASYLELLRVMIGMGMLCGSDSEVWEFDGRKPLIVGCGWGLALVEVPPLAVAPAEHAHANQHEQLQVGGVCHGNGGGGQLVDWYTTGSCAPSCVFQQRRSSRRSRCADRPGARHDGLLTPNLVYGWMVGRSQDRKTEKESNTYNANYSKPASLSFPFFYLLSLPPGG